MSILPFDVPEPARLASAGMFEGQFWLTSVGRLKSEVPRRLWSLRLDCHRGRHLGVLARVVPDLGSMPKGGMAVHVRARAFRADAERVIWIDELRRLETREVVCGARLIAPESLPMDGRPRLKRLVAFHEELHPLRLRELLTRVLIDPQVVSRPVESRSMSVLDQALRTVPWGALVRGAKGAGARFQVAALLLAIQRAMPQPGEREDLANIPVGLKGIVGPALWRQLEVLSGQDQDTYLRLCAQLSGLAQQERQQVENASRGADTMTLSRAARP